MELPSVLWHKDAGQVQFVNCTARWVKDSLLASEHAPHQPWSKLHIIYNITYSTYDTHMLALCKMQVLTVQGNFVDADKAFAGSESLPETYDSDWDTIMTDDRDTIMTDDRDISFEDGDETKEDVDQPDESLDNPPTNRRETVPSPTDDSGVGQELRPGTMCFPWCKWWLIDDHGLSTRLHANMQKA